MKGATFASVGRTALQLQEWLQALQSMQSIWVGEEFGEYSRLERVVQDLQTSWFRKMLVRDEEEKALMERIKRGRLQSQERRQATEVEQVCDE